MRELDFQPHFRGLPYLRAKVNFPNGYRASVLQLISREDWQALYEVAILTEEGCCYDTGLTTDTEHFDTKAEVCEFLDKIEALPPRGEAK